MKPKLTKILTALSESVCYIVVSYTLSSMYTSFKTSWFSVLFSASNLWITYKYWESIKQITGSKGIAVIACVSCFLAYIALALSLGYIQGAFTPFASFW